MTWFKVDDGFWSHPKTMGLSADAIALWVRAGSYSCQHLTDGVILSRVTPMLDPSETREQHADELIAAGLWKRIPNGYKFHDWDEYQETSADVKKRRDQWKQRQRKARESREESREESRVTHADVTRESLSPVPSRPVHSPSESRGGKKPTRAHRLPDDWTPTQDHRQLAAERGIDVDLEADKMRDWAAAKGETGKDWNARFRNWIRNAKPEHRRDRAAGSAIGLVQAHHDLFGDTA